MERERERVRKVTEGVTGLGMNEDTRRAEEMVAVWCTKKERRKEKVETLSMGPPREQKRSKGEYEGGVGGSNNSSGGVYYSGRVGS